jgi:hypothetical protein
MNWSYTLQAASISQPGNYFILLDAVDQANKHLRPLGRANRPASRAVLIFEVPP